MYGSEGSMSNNSIRKVETIKLEDGNKRDVGGVGLRTNGGYSPLLFYLPIGGGIRLLCSSFIPGDRDWGFGLGGELE